MANNKSAEKRNRQNKKRRAHNASIKSSLRTAAKKVLKAIGANNPEDAKNNYKQFSSRIDTAATKGVIHKKTAARKKSRLARRVNASLKKSS